MAITGEVLRLTMLAGLSLAGILVIFIWMRDLTRKASYLRIFVQIVSEFAIFYIITYEKRLSLVLVIVLLITLVLGRFFCGWICPFGFYMDLVTLLRKSFKTRYRSLPERLNRNLHRLRYAILSALLILPFFLVGPADIQLWPLAIFLLGPFNPPRILLSPMVPVVTPWKALYGLNLNYPYVDQIIYYSRPNSVLANMLLF